MQFTFVGSANPADFRNLRLLVNGTQAATLATASTETVFTLATPIRLATGQSTIQIFADVAGGPNRTATFSLLQNYKVNATDTQYGAGISASVDSTSQTTITINSGSITVQTATNSPTTPVPAGASGVTLGTFTIYAAGEPVQIKFIDVTLTKTGGTAWVADGTFTDDLSNLSLRDSMGGQVGNTISTLSGAGGSGQCSVTSTTVLTCHFGTVGSSINYTVPANTTVTLSAVADIGTNTDLTTISAGLGQGSSNLQGQISSKTASSGVANGATRTITTSSLTPSIHGAYSNPTIIAGAQHQLVGAFDITASSAQGAQISSLTFTTANDAGLHLQTMQVFVGSTQFGSTAPTIANADTKAFSGSTPIVIQPGQVVEVDVYADVLSTTTTTTHQAITLAGWSAIGSISGSSITMTPSTVTGQTLNISSGPTLTVAADSSTPPAKQLVMGTNGVELFDLRLNANNVDNVRLTNLIFTDTQTGGSGTNASFQNLTLWDGTTQVGNANETMSSVTTGTVTFSLSPAVIVNKSSSKTLTLKGDVATFSAGAVSGSVHTFTASTTAGFVTAYSVGNSTATVIVSSSSLMSSNAVTVYRTKLMLSGAMALGSTTTRTRQFPDDVAQFTFNNTGSTDQLTVSTVNIKFQGLAVSTGTTFNVSLLKTDNSAFGNATTQSCGPTVANSCTVSFSPSFILSQGAHQDVKVRVDSSTFFNSSTAGEEGVSILINGTTDVLWNDGTTGSIPLEASVVPFPITTVSYN